MSKEEVVGVSAEAKVTTKSLYFATEKFLSSSSPGRPANQAQRMLVSVFAALEQLTANERALYCRIHSWWILLQSWGTMRFSDHHGLQPAEITVTGNKMSARRTRSKTTCDDKDVAFRMVHMRSRLST